jgi:hypothetical protein
MHLYLGGARSVACRLTVRASLSRATIRALVPEHQR